MSTNEDMKPEVVIRNPEIRKLLKSLERMPEYLEERRKKIAEKKEFRRRVFEQACRDAGLIPANGKLE